MSAPRDRQSPANFNRLARCYRALEFLAFGRDLERVRFWPLEELRMARSVLVMGEGDGRFLARLVRQSPQATIHCIDASPAMLACAARRIPAAERSRVNLHCGDALRFDFTPQTYDAVVTLFFLDCFTTPQIESLIARIVPRLRPGAQWIFGDFVVPVRGWSRLRARLWLRLLYTFFRWGTGLRVNTLPDSEGALERAGFVLGRAREFQHGLLRAAVYRHP